MNRRQLLMRLWLSTLSILPLMAMLALRASADQYKYQTPVAPGVATPDKLETSIHRFERMRLRGLSGVRDEFHLAAIVQNLRTLASRIWRPPPSAAAVCGA